MTDNHKEAGAPVYLIEERTVIAGGGYVTVSVPVMKMTKLSVAVTEVIAFGYVVYVDVEVKVVVAFGYDVAVVKKVIDLDILDSIEVIYSITAFLSSYLVTTTAESAGTTTVEV